MAHLSTPGPANETGFLPHPCANHGTGGPRLSHGARRKKLQSTRIQGCDDKREWEWENAADRSRDGRDESLEGRRSTADIQRQHTGWIQSRVGTDHLPPEPLRTLVTLA